MNLHIGVGTGVMGEVWVGVIAPSLPDFKDTKAGVCLFNEEALG